MSPTETDLEARLRTDLRARQDDVPPAPADLADLVRRRHRGQRRTQGLTLVAAAAVVAVFAGVAGVVATPRTADTSDTAEEAPRSPEPSILERPTRGSLADDADWLAGVRRLDWQVPTDLTGELPDPPANERHVVFAGDVPGGRVALVAGEDDGRIGAAWFSGPADAQPGDMAPVNLPAAIGRHEPLALLRTEGTDVRGGVLVVVTAPGDRVDLSASPVVGADGTETRARVELPAEDGIVVSEFEGAWWLGRQVRVLDGDGDPDVVRTLLVDTDGADPLQPPPSVSEARPDQAVVDDLVGEILGEYDLTAEEARPTVLARGNGYEDERVLLVGLTFPSGATGAWLLTAEQYGEGTWSGGLARLPHAPAGTALEDRVIAMPVNGYSLALHGPDGAVRAEVLTEDGAVLGSVELTDGGFVGEVPGGSFAPSTDGAASVRLLEADGGVVAEGPIGRVVDE